MRGRHGATLRVGVERGDDDDGGLGAARDARREDPEHVDALSRHAL